MKRYWMTGCMALVMLAADRTAMADDEFFNPALERQGCTSLTSRRSLDETIRSIEQSAQQEGLVVMACLPVGSRASMAANEAVQLLSVPADAQQGADAGQGATEVPQATVLVLGDAGGQTPLMQADGEAVPRLPLAVLLTRLPDGATHVRYTDGDTWLNDARVPEEFRLPLKRLPRVMEVAADAATTTA